MTKLTLPIGPSSTCPWDILLESVSYWWIKYMKVCFLDFTLTDVKWLGHMPSTWLNLQNTLQKHSVFLVYTAAAVALKSLRKVNATYSLIIVPDGIRHIGRHFFCTLKLKQNIALHGPASERDQLNTQHSLRNFLTIYWECTPITAIKKKKII